MSFRVTERAGGGAAADVDRLDWRAILASAPLGGIIHVALGSARPFLEVHHLSDCYYVVYTASEDTARDAAVDLFGTIRCSVLDLHLIGPCDAVVLERLSPTIGCVNLHGEVGLPPAVERAFTAAACRRVKRVNTTMSVESGAALLAHMEADPGLAGFWREEIKTPHGQVIEQRIRLLTAYDIGGCLLAARRPNTLPVPDPVFIEAFLHSLGWEPWFPRPIGKRDPPNPRFDLVNRTLECFARAAP